MKPLSFEGKKVMCKIVSTSINWTINGGDEAICDHWKLFQLKFANLLKGIFRLIGFPFLESWLSVPNKCHIKLKNIILNFYLASDQTYHWKVQREGVICDLYGSVELRSDMSYESHVRSSQRASCSRLVVMQRTIQHFHLIIYHQIYFMKVIWLSRYKVYPPCWSGPHLKRA